LRHEIQRFQLNAQKINDYLGPTRPSDELPIDDWQDLVAEAHEELATLDRYTDLFGLVYMASAVTDGDWLEHAVNQLGLALEQISLGKKIDPLQMGAVQAVAEEALEAVRLQNSAAIAAAVVTTLKGYMEGLLRSVETRARIALEKLRILQEALEEAKRKRNESIVQGVVDGLILVAMIVQPELILLSGIKAAVGQKLMDDAFGGSKSTPTRDKLSTHSTNASIAQASLETFHFLTPAKSVPYIKAAGKPLAVVGLAFDADEIYAAVKNVEKIRSAINSLMPVLRKLKYELDVLQPKVMALRLQAKGVHARIEDARREAAEHSTEYYYLAREAKLAIYSMVQWRTL
jgi:hypothetical protein